uniref:Uncharacterized protein n=1 Tax=Arundo donax TaxID=35708 RepID=A0A0A9DYI6_ARUDO
MPFLLSSASRVPGILFWI